MKKLILSCMLPALFLSAAYAQYGTGRTGYEGDYFSLEGALELFKQSYSLSDFERKLNTEDRWVNNLDLNYDGRIDYIRVEHRRQGNFHAIILQALLGRYDIQDVAVIEIEIIRRGEAVLQIVGDEDLYGEEVIVEPVEGYSDSRGGYRSDYGDYVNVYYWEPVQHILGRQYVVYASPYRWQYYPVWWSPWMQCSWSIFRPRIVVYHRHYHVVHIHRVVHVHNFYRPYRSYSYNVVQYTNEVRVRHGKPPVHRPRPATQQVDNPGQHSRRDNVVEQPRSTAPSAAPAQSPSVSRKRAEPSYNNEAPRNTTPEAGQRSRSAASPASPRSTAPAPRAAEPGRRVTPSSDQKTDRNTAPQANQQSREMPDRSRAATRSTAPAPKPQARPEQDRSTAPGVRQPSRNEAASPRPATPAPKPQAGSRTAPQARPEANRNTAPKAKQPSRNETASPRATAPAQKPSASSRSTAPAPQRSTAPKSSSPKSNSGSRGGRDF